MKANKATRCISLHIAAVLLIVLLALACVQSGVFAKYSTTNSGMEGARVAVFNIAPGESYAADEIIVSGIVPGDVRSWEFQFNANSEVSVKYTAYLESSGNLPLIYTIVGNNGSSDVEVMLQSGRSSTIYTLPPMTGTCTLRLKISWPVAANSPQYSGRVDSVKLIITAEQVD